MDGTETIVDRIEEKCLMWYGHMKRMEDHRWSKMIYIWTPPEMKTRGRTRVCHGEKKV
ncbi:hypothetical protein C0J52_21990 [Blattella germanica]|nr:hypothetical protein C0J52_21990 [Blattella germanica]